MAKKGTLDGAVEVSKANPKAAKNFNKYMHEADADVKKAQEKFAKEINKAVQKAVKAFIKGEGLKLSKEEIDAMTASSDKICKDLCKYGDKAVKAQFKEMSKKVKDEVKAK